MKKILSIILLICMLCTVFAACNNKPENNGNETVAGPTLADAVEYITSTYKSDEGKATPADYSLIAQIPIDGVKFPVKWTVDNADIEIVAENGLYTVKLPSSNDKEAKYTLTATVSDAAGKTQTLTFTRVLPVYDRSLTVTSPKAGVAYKLFLEQASIGKTLFATHTISSKKYIATTAEPKEGAEFYVEAADNGVKIYTTIDGVKNYVYAWTEKGEDDKVSKFIGYSAEKSSVFIYHADVNAWFTTINDVDYVVGTYSSYDTICISESTYISATNTGVSQFPLSFMTKESAEHECVDADKDYFCDICNKVIEHTCVDEDKNNRCDICDKMLTTETLSIKDALALGATFEKDAYSKDKYYVSGTVTEIQNDKYGNIVISDGTDSILIYGLFNADGTVRYDAMEKKPQVGDTIKVLSIVGKYNDAQLKNAWLIEAQGHTCKYPETGLTAVCEICGEVKEHTCADADKNYKCDACGKVLDHTCVDADKNNRCDICDKSLVTETLSIKDALTLGATFEKDKYSTDKYFIIGTITEIQSTTYGNMLISDGTDTILIYGLYNEDGTVRYDAMEKKPQVGDTIKVLSVVGKYNDAQLKNAWLIETQGHTCKYPETGLTAVCEICGEVKEHTCADADTNYKCDACGKVLEHTCVDADKNNKCDICDKALVIETLSIKDAIALGGTFAKDKYSADKYYISGTVTEIKDETYGNIMISDGTNSILVYGLYSEDGTVRYDKMEKKLNVGDTIKVLSVVGKYNDAQLKNAWLIETTGHTCKYPATGLTAVCEICGETKEHEHSYKGACVAECEACGEARTELGEHTYANDCAVKCSFCDFERTDAPHKWTNSCDAVCDGEGCSFTRTAGCKDADPKDGACDACGANMKSDAEIAADNVAAVKNALTWDVTAIEADGEYALPTNTSFADVTITWTSSDASVVVGTNEKITVALGSEEKTVTLTATIKSGDATATKTFQITVAKKREFVFNIVDTLVADTAYKGYINQVVSNKKIYLDGNVSGRYLSTTTSLNDAVSVYAEQSGDGYKFYISVEGAKKYIEVYTNSEEKISVQYSENASIFTYDATINAWVTPLADESYYLGTYSTFDTISASKTSFIDEDNTGVTQLPLEWVSYSCTHSYVADCEDTCTNCGYVRTDAAAHTWTDACDTDCENCDATRKVTHNPEFPCSSICKDCSAPVAPGEHVDASPADGKCDNCKTDLSTLPATETVELDFVTNFATYAAEWASAYGKHEITFDQVGSTAEGKVTLSNGNKQQEGNAIDDRPVICAKLAVQYVTVDLGTSTKKIQSVTFDLAQWSSKTLADIHIEYTIDGTTWVSCSDSITTPAVLESDPIPSGVISVRLSYVAAEDKNTQIGLSGITLEIA